MVTVTLQSSFSFHLLNQNFKKKEKQCTLPLSVHLAVTIGSRLSARHERNRKLLRLWRMSELVVDDTPSPLLLGALCVCSSTAGNPGQDCMWSEAGRQLVEWDASVAGGYKVSFQRHTRDHPHSPSYSLCCALFVVKAAYKMNGDTTRVKPTKNATCTMLKSTQHKYTRQSWAWTHYNSSVLGNNVASVSKWKASL